MELPMAAAIAVLFAAGTYQILRPNLIRVVMGFALYGNAANLLLITMGGYTRDSAAPFVDEVRARAAQAPPLMDPLPPDIILTAIVISFAVGALLLVVCYRLYLDTGNDDPHRLGAPAAQDDAGCPGGAAVVSAHGAELAPGRRGADGRHA